ncbi:MAG: undecaprenyldiphospho-muramoylpentapeptide beta-N-acetylglucosaminyltransferase [Desulfobacterium sp.]|jgi:UDP-N-acetylglucosamine--N-acetylmuramyl-(pentapeptide) pyrophosphoryl-undecaprenol N-acetylglucosamine transferase|nr:undecaprenyldiphospho-muramoylpentapeptide beta-N-acetylglucosaminyltransferase [Desulfobacterium sp.]
MDKQDLNILIAGGKTGGHLFPGIAIAQAFSDRVPGTRILFVGTGQPFETSTLDCYGFAHTAISVSPIKGRGLVGKLAALVRLPLSLVQAIAVLRKFKPDLVLGVGGYSSGPVVVAARFLRIKTAVQEQNTIPGITNRILSRVCHLVFTSFEDTRGLSKRAVVHHTGNPVRKLKTRNKEAGAGAEKSPLDHCPAENSRELDPAVFNLLVTGGSQGARSINQAMMGAMALLDDPASIRLIHQTGVSDEAEVARTYQDLNMNGEARAFFDDLPDRMAGADLIVARAGAGTISEIISHGKPSILVPYPHAADDHQRFNAEAVVNRGGAEMILDRELSPERLKIAIEALENDREKRLAMGRAARGMAIPDPAGAIVDLCEQLLNS